jgi:Ca-activated chloride channel family protein
MKKILFLCFLFILVVPAVTRAQSGRNRRVESAAKPGAPSATPQPSTTTDETEGISDSRTDAAGETVEGDVVRVDTSLITVPVTVLDRGGKYVPNLKRSDFRIFEEGVEQKVAYFATEDQPFTVVMLIDTSGSTHFRLEDIQDAAITFVNQLKPADSVMVISFDDRIDVLGKPTTDRNAITRAIRRTSTGGGTRLYDAVDVVLKKHLQTISGRKAIVLFTDGVDTTSHRASYESTVRAAEESDAPIYVVDYDTSGFNGAMGQGWPLPGRPRGTIFGLPVPLPSGGGVPGGPGANPGDYRRASAYLHELSAVTGGRFFNGDSMMGISQAFAEIAQELGRQYSLGYYPKTLGQAGQRRQIKVRVIQTGLVVKARDSYIYTEKKSTTDQPKETKPFSAVSKGE